MLNVFNAHIASVHAHCFTCSCLLQALASMTYFNSYEEFAKAVERLHNVSGDKCRLVTKYKADEGRITIKYTDDIVCLQFASDQQQDLRRLEKLTATLLRAATVA
uniref:SRP9-21 domain-containing protein n=1 Tax=Panagrellus redivivus TaxID=6233 RepID=A0A7E4W1T0_PANRE